jgi:type I restriction enzyme S subunit
MDKLPNGWKVAKIKSVVQKTETYNPQNSKDSIFNYIDIGSIDNSAFKLTQPKEILGKDAPSRARKRVRKGDVIFATTRPNLKNIAQIEIDYYNSVASTGFCILRPITEIDSKFLFYFLLTENIQNQIAPFIRGAQYPAISDNDLYSCSIPLPPLSEQINLVTKLDALFVRIDKSIALLEENIKHTKGLVASVLDETFGKIDTDNYLTIDELSDLVTKGSSPTWQGIKYTDNINDVLFITSENVGSYNLLLDKRKYLQIEFNEIQPRSILQKGDILMNIVGASIGRTAIFDIEINANINQAVCLIRLKRSKIDLKYALHFFNSPRCINLMFDNQVENARANLSMGNIKKFLIPIPSMETQRKISNKLDLLMIKTNGIILAQQSKLAYLKALKSSLLNQAFKGDL